jgi:hypothetical protein
MASYDGLHGMFLSASRAVTALALTAILSFVMAADARAEARSPSDQRDSPIFADAKIGTVPSARRPVSASSALAVTNFQDKETVRYPVVLLLGTIRDANATEIAVINRSAKKESKRNWSGIAHRGRFKALVELQPGKNQLEISAGKAKTSLILGYRLQTNPYVIRMVYFTDKSGKTAFQTPIADDPQDFRGKFDTALKLLQCFTAEEMNAQGYGRRTFNLELDENGRVVTHILKGDLAEEDYWKMDDGKIYELVDAAIGRQMPNPNAINLAVLQFTSFDPATKINRAHTALGGGDLALFGGSSIYTWSNSIAGVQRACMDATMTDVARFASDSIGRNSYWANTSTQTGACLHELGHAFGMPHSADYNGIMVRGIDNFTRKFVFVDPPSAANAQPIEFKDDEIGRWEPVSLASMAFHRHFALDKRTWSERNTISLELDAKAGTVTVESEDGLRFVGVDAPGREDFFIPIDPLKPAPRQVVISLADVGRKVASKEAAFRIIDAEGHTKNVSLEEIAKPWPNQNGRSAASQAIDMEALATLVSGNFVRDWHFSKVTQPWGGPPGFAPVNAAKLKEIVDSALSSPLATSPNSMVEFAPQFPADKHENVAGYAVRKIVSDRSRKVRLWSGSDDALRIWLNGRLLQEVSANREAKPDSESCDATLPQGESVLVAEVSQGNGGWGLILRLQDAQGADLAVAPDGRVMEWPNLDCRVEPQPK